MTNGILEYGVVVDELGGEIAVEVTSTGACDSCPIHDTCHAAEQVVWIPKKDDIHVGDHVHFSIGHGSPLKISALVYGVPLFALLAGTMAGYLVFFSRLADDTRALLSFAAGIGLTGIAGFVISRFDAKLRNSLQTCFFRLERTQGESYQGERYPARSHRAD